MIEWITEISHVALLKIKIKFDCGVLGRREVS
jgi:hypothetical protein